ncbi:MAG: hypothetical protein QM754_04415 [Tepidisphaeraceae bacterium]
MRECFSSPHYLWIFAAFTLTSLAANPINSWSIVYAKQLSLSMDRWDEGGIGIGTFKLGYGGIIAITYVFSLFLAYPIGALVDRFHPLRVAITAMLVYGVSCFVGYALIDNASSFGWAFWRTAFCRAVTSRRRPPWLRCFCLAHGSASFCRRGRSSRRFRC